MTVNEENRSISGIVHQQIIVMKTTNVWQGRCSTYVKQASYHLATDFYLNHILKIKTCKQRLQRTCLLIRQHKIMRKFSRKLHFNQANIQTVQLH